MPRAALDASTCEYRLCRWRRSEKTSLATELERRLQMLTNTTDELVALKAKHASTLQGHAHAVDELTDNIHALEDQLIETELVRLALHVLLLLLWGASAQLHRIEQHQALCAAFAHLLDAHATHLE